MNSGYINNVLETYTIAKKEIKKYCESVNQSFEESHKIMLEMSNNSLIDKAEKMPPYSRINIFEEYIDLWEDIKWENNINIDMDFTNINQNK